MQYFTLLIKPAGPDCNLKCRYCFYAGKTGLFGPGRHRMNDEVLERLVGDYMGQGFAQGHFAWQGGEPTLMGLEFYQKVVELQEVYAGEGQVVGNSLQTNAILLDERWCEFLHEHNFLVGISLDGPQKYHDHYRQDHVGGGTFERVMQGIDNCRKHKVEFNILVLLNDKNVAAPDELFDFFIENDFKYLQFIPCVERDAQTGEITDYSITPKQYGDFMCRIFDRWQEIGPRQLSIRMFDSILARLLRGEHTVCKFRRRCNEYVVVEHNGDVFSCDFFVEDRWRLGNIMETPLAELALGKRKDEFARLKRKIGNKCTVCRYGTYCHGGCLKDRIILSDDYSCPDYFCESYQQFFDHTLPRFQILAGEL
ncbi:MAG: anaerobic sulfatase maturase [Sedimentisphaerales bacterium]|nr:anaerobic sulfatase maturase [Sedimentisphaerales bacterium]